MQFEISIEGPSPLIRDLSNDVGDLSPLVQNISAETDGPRTRIVLVVEDPDLLNRRMTVVSAAVRRVERRFSVPNSLRFRVRNLAYSEPPGASPQFAEPFRPIPGLTVQPSTPLLTSRPDTGTILLDPGHAFGTGKHPSTVLCLQVMHRMAQETAGPISLQGADVLDFGCGTGLLAIAAVTLGAGSAFGVEIDPDSVSTARANVSRNGLEGRIRIQEGSWDVVHGQYHVIFANLVPAALLKSGAFLPLHLWEAGMAVISGFGHQQTEEMKACFESSGLLVSQQMALKGWSALLACKTEQRRLSTLLAEPSMNGS